MASAWQRATVVTNTVISFRNKLAAVRIGLTKWTRGKFAKRDTYLRRSKWILRQLDYVEEIRP